MATKQCTRCGIEKPLTEYHKDRSRPTGYYCSCKTCHKQRVNDFHNSWGSGIYKVINKITNDFYIGQSTQLRRRKCEHFTNGRQAETKSPILDNNIQQYGKTNFEFIILKKCNTSELTILEKQYIQELQPTLNNI